MNKIILVLIAATIGLTSCNSNEKGEKVNNETQKETSSDTLVTNKISVEEIDKIRTKIESLQIAPIELSTISLREKIKQKWSKIHFYIENDIVIKVKTYPHEDISRRTEEFYANNDGLLLVVVEDKGELTKDKETNEMDKMYYFNNNKLIKEINKEKSEFTIKDSDAEEFVAEFNEYLEILKQTRK